MLTDELIEEAKKRIKFGPEHGPHHEHNDCVRIAYEWLDAQKKTKIVVRRSRGFKTYVRNWGGRYISKSDVDIAADLHPDVFGSYPRFNISRRLTRPRRTRLENIGQAFSHSYEERRGGDNYFRDE